MKLDDIKTIGRNIEHGAWVGKLPNLPGIAVKVRGTYNSDYTRRFAELRAGLSDQEAEDPGKQDAIDVQLVIETVLEGWAGIDDTPYSVEMAERLLTDPDYKVFRRAVNWAANVVANEGRKTVEEALKN